jgi:PTS system nitrogen regulatory IIA component
LAILARINHQIADSIGDIKKYFRRNGAMPISAYLDSHLILFLEESTRDDVISRLVDALDRSGKLVDKKQFHTAILDREKIVSTGIGIGVAIPHAKLSGYKDFFIAIAILKKKGVDWHALDGQDVRLVFMIGGPDERQTDYLKILSTLTQAIKDEALRKKMLKTITPNQVMDLFQGC